MPAVVQRRNGFTLLEVILAMALIVMMMAIGWPALQGFGEEKKLQASFTSVAEEIEAGLQVARETGSDHWLHLHDGFLLVTDAPWWPEDAVGDGATGELLLLGREAAAGPVRLWASGHAEPFRLEWRGPGGRWVAGMGPLDQRLRIDEWEVGG